MNFKNLPTALKVELKTCNIVLVRTFHKASKIMIAKTISMIITAVIVHICAQQSKTYFTAVRAGVFCVMSMQVSYPDISLVCGEDPRMCEVLPEVLPNTSRVLDWSGHSRLDEKQPQGPWSAQSYQPRKTLILGSVCRTIMRDWHKHVLEKTIR